MLKDTLDLSHAVSWQRYSPKNLTEGARPPLLLVQGFACGKDDWGALTKMLASKAKRDVLTFDHRGIGASDVPEGPYAVNELAADALADERVDRGGCVGAAEHARPLVYRGYRGATIAFFT